MGGRPSSLKEKKSKSTNEKESRKEYKTKKILCTESKLNFEYFGDIANLKTVIYSIFMLKILPIEIIPLIIFDMTIPKKYIRSNAGKIKDYTKKTPFSGKIYHEFKIGLLGEPFGITL
jgi:hypothetical protein